MRIRKRASGFHTINITRTNTRIPKFKSSFKFIYWSCMSLFLVMLILRCLLFLFVTRFFLAVYMHINLFFHYIQSVIVWNHRTSPANLSRSFRTRQNLLYILFSLLGLRIWVVVFVFFSLAMRCLMWHCWMSHKIGANSGYPHPFSVHFIALTCALCMKPRT